MSVLDRFSLRGKVAAVTGTTRGIGQALAYALADAGADVVQIDRSPSDETQAGIEARSVRATQVRLDLANGGGADYETAVERATGHFGRLDILVNSAGIVNRAPFLSQLPEDAAAVVNLDLLAPMALTRAAAPYLRANGEGRVINVASLMSFQGGLNVAAYAASKHGIVGLTKALANEWGRDGITVNAIAPGYIATPINEDLRADQSRASEFASRIPLGRWGVPDDLAGAVVFLASPAAGYVTGTVLVVDGGWLSR